MKVAYCTVLNAAFVPRALTLQRSITVHSPNAGFAFYCIDDAAVALLRALAPANSWIVAPDEFETSELRGLKTALKPSEYCWTCKPVSLRHALLRDPAIDWAVWLDADMLAFGDLNSALADVPQANVALTPHSFSLPEFQCLEPVVGQFNAGYVAFRNSDEGRRALDWWLQRCLEACPAVPVDGKYADQKYLDDIATQFSNVAALSSNSVNVAPWNIFNKTVDAIQGRVMISGEPLLLYHFQGLKVLRSRIFNLYASARVLPGPVRRLIYRPYTAALASEMRAVAGLTRDRRAGLDAAFVGAGSLMQMARQLPLARNIQIQLT